MESSPTNSGNRESRSEPGYDYIKEIASGGYGYVYLFRRVGQDRGEIDYVAGKFVYRHVFGPPDDPSSNAAYQRSMEGLQNFRSLGAESQYLLRIFDVRQRHEEGYFCYMMELADDMKSRRQVDPGNYKPRTLKHELQRHGHRQRLSATNCIDIAIGLARGLQLLHEGGFAHRDVRPSNIIFVNGFPKLADIDLLAGHHTALTSYIPKHYAAPEGSHSSLADIFSLGKTLYEMCTGRPVADYPSLPPDIRHWEDHRVLLMINKIIAKACARDLRERYISAAQMVNDLERIRTERREGQLR